MGTGQPSHPCSAFLPKGKIGRNEAVVNKMLQWQTHKNRYGGSGVNASAGGLDAVVTAFSNSVIEIEHTGT